MNHRSSGLSIPDAIEDLLQFKLAEGLRPRTVVGYRHDLREWFIPAGDKDVTQVNAQDIRAFLIYFRTDYKPLRFSSDLSTLSPKTIRNCWVSLSALFSWLSREFDPPSPSANVTALRFSQAEIEPFNQDEVAAQFKACAFKREARTTFRRCFTMRRATVLRDRAIILFLLDTGLRSSELCALNLGDVEIKTGKMVVRHGPAGGSKGGRGRTVYLGNAARRSLWRYVVTCEDRIDDGASLFTARHRSLNRDTLRHLIVSRLKFARMKGVASTG